KCYNCKKEGNFAKDCKKAKVKDYNYYKTKMLLEKKDSDEQVLSESDESSSSAEETIAEVAYYTSESESEYEFETLEYYDKSTNYVLFVNNDDDQEIFHDAIESASENFIENHINSQKDYDKSEVDHNDSEEKEHLVDKLIRKFNHKISKCQKRIEKANQQSKDFENQNKDLQEKYDVLINQRIKVKMIVMWLKKNVTQWRIQRKFYSKLTNNNLRTSSSSQSANKKQEFVKTGDKKEDKKADEKKRDIRKVKCYNCKKEGHFAKDCKKAKVKDYESYKTKMLLAKKDKDEQVLLAEDQAWMESSSDSDQEINANMVFMAQINKVLSNLEASSSFDDEKISEEINANMVFMAQIENVLLESDKSSSSAEETIAEVAYYTSESKSEYEFETSEYYDNSTNYGLFVNNDDDQEIFHDAIESASNNLIENHIDSQKDYDKSEVDHNDSKEKTFS
nr:hypothetical protein [Tanacetum cinerariifolium]